MTWFLHVNIRRLFTLYVCIVVASAPRNATRKIQSLQELNRKIQYSLPREKVCVSSHLVTTGADEVVERNRLGNSVPSALPTYGSK